MRFAAGFILPLLTALSIAGCSGDTPEDTGPSPPTASSYVITLEGFPVAPIPSNSTFTFTSRITGDETRTSDHIGAHYGPNSTESPSVTAYPSACQHQGGELPGTYQVTCTSPVLPGTYYLRGHARIAHDNTTTSWWSSEQTFLVIA